MRRREKHRRVAAPRVCQKVELLGQVQRRDRLLNPRHAFVVVPVPRHAFVVVGANGGAVARRRACVQPEVHDVDRDDAEVRREALEHPRPRAGKVHVSMHVQHGWLAAVLASSHIEGRAVHRCLGKRRLVAPSRPARMSEHRLLERDRAADPLILGQ